jgi:hypothetical protein
MPPRNHNCRPTVEALEDRLVPTSTRMVIDFTPDRGTRGQFPGSNRGTFQQLFQNAAASGSTAHFLDFNGNGVVDAEADAQGATDTIINLVNAYF